jgi:putative tryptophan/tyrosine transport system substrate-binding protein
MEEKQLAQDATLSDSRATQPEIQKVSPNPKKSKLWLIIIGIIFLILAAIAGYFLISSQNKKQIAENKIYHVGVLACLEFFQDTPAGFKEGMVKLGYVEGKNITYDIQKRPTETDGEMKQILQGFVNDKVDLIVVVPTNAALKAKEITKGTGVPVIFASAFTEGNNLIDTVSAPGGNITGVRSPSSAELGVKNLKILHEIAPQAKRIWVAYEKDYPSMSDQIEVLNQTARSLGMTLVEIPVRSVTDIQADLDARAKLSNLGIDVVMASSSPTASSSKGLEIVNAFVTKYNLPMVGGANSIFVLGPDPLKSGKQTAYLADKILRGANPGAIPVVSAESRLVINYKIAKKLGLTVPESLLNIADEITR